MPRRGENIYKLRDCRWKGRILSDNGYHSVSIHGCYEVKQKLRNYPGTIINALSSIIFTPNSTVKCHNSCHSSVNLLGGFFLICLDVACGVGADIDVVHIPPQNRVTAVRYFLFKHQFH